MEVRGEFTEHDYLRAQWLHIAPRRGLRVVGYVILALFALALVLTIHRGVSEADPWRLALAIAAVVALAGLALWHRYLWGRLYRRQPSLQGLHVYSFSHEGIVASSPHGSGQVSWSAFTKWREDSRMFLIYQADNVFHLVPKRWFADEQQISELRALLAKHSGLRVV
jgi:hypothetical protein